MLIVDEHGEVRGGVRSLLHGAANLEVVGEAAGGRDALAQCKRLRPNLVVMDIHIGDMDGLALTRAIKQDWPETYVVVLTLDGGPITLLNALRSGADGYVLKGAPRSEFLSVVRDVLREDSPIHPALARWLLDVLQVNRGESVVSGAMALSETEIKVLQLRATGSSHAQIARDLHMDAKEVRAHMERVVDKLANVQDGQRRPRPRKNR